MSEPENEVIENKPKNIFVHICITQTICIVVILITVLIIKYFFSGSYDKLQKWYSKNILDETNVSEIFDGESDNEI